MVVLAFRLKETTLKGIGTSLYILVPNMVLQSTILFLGTYNSVNTPPPPIQNDETVQTLNDAEKRIKDLESHTRYLEIYLKHSREQMFMLIGTFGVFYSIPLFLIALALAKTKKSEFEKDKYIEELK
jgi:hypothetical protein